MHIQVDILPRMTHESVAAYFQWGPLKSKNLYLFSKSRSTSRRSDSVREYWKLKENTRNIYLDCSSLIPFK